MAFTIEEKRAIDGLVENWLNIDINPDSQREIRDLQQAGEYKVLDGKLTKRIAFGTAGLRSEMTSGFAHMNDVTILQASQGLVEYVVAGNTDPSIVIGYDHRFNSQRFAEITASVALSQGVKVYYLGSVENLSQETLRYEGGASHSSDGSSFVHTPSVPFTIDHFHASAGVMVTASHNPAKDNGFKVYYNNGCQIIPPHDDGIASSIAENLSPWYPEVWNVAANFQQALKTNLLVSVKDEMASLYISKAIKNLVTTPKLSSSFVYTPIHGVGLEILDKCFKAAFSGYTMEVVHEQAFPDPKFPTVKFPNPEEKGALDLSISTAEKLGYKLVIANDPDADRFSTAVKTKGGDWQQLTGNEIGFLFAMYFIEEVVPQDQLSNTYLLNSTVSSQILKAMAEKKGFHFQDTLTGFKWIGNRAIDLQNEGYSVPFAYEEAIGFMFNLVSDKDGVAAAMIWLQLYELWFVDGKTDVIEKLQQGYEKYGWFKEYNGYYRLDDLNKTKEIFDTVRGGYTSYPDTIGLFTAVEWRDLTVGFETGTEGNVPILPIDHKSQMITGVLSDGKDTVRFTCRGSGTEPKLKVYIEGRAGDEVSAKGIAKKCWDVLREEWFKPEVNGLVEVV